MVFPPPPTTAIDWDNVGFKVRPVNGHIQATYSHTTKQWSAPRFVTDPYLNIHVMATGLNYGQQCYEGVKALRNPDDASIHIFRPDANALRMQNSARFIGIPVVPEELFLRCVHEVVARNAEFVPPNASGAAMYIRPLLLGTSPQLGLTPANDYTFVVFVIPVGGFQGVRGVHGIDALVLENYDRTAPMGAGSAKVGGNYAPVLVHSEVAREEGFGITLHLDSKTRTYIDEFSTSGFLALKYEGDRTTLIVSDSKNVIKSVTSNSLQQIARDLGWAVEVRGILFEECEHFDEVMAAGTAVTLAPIKSITKKSTGTKYEYYSGDKHPAGAMKLLTMLKGIQAGKLEDKHGWRQQVAEPTQL